MKPTKAPLGIHTSISPSILAGLEYAHALGATAVQIFTGSNMTSSLKDKHKLTPDEIQQIRQFRKNTGMALVIHAVYVLNFCAFPPTSGRIQFAHTNLRWDLEQAQKLGGGLVVLHIGNKMTLTREEAYKNMAANIQHTLKWMQEHTPDVVLCLETPAGQGTQIATNLDDLAELWNLICVGPNHQQTKTIKTTAKNHKISAANSSANRITPKPAAITNKYNPTTHNHQLGICIDTAHIFGAGVDIRTPKGLKDYLAEFDQKIGLQFLRSIHLNDSRQPLASRKDQHTGLADGYIFKDDHCLSVVRELVSFAKQRQIPIILETHRAGSTANPDGELYAQEIGLLNQFRDGVSRTGCNWRLVHKTGSKSELGKRIRSNTRTKTRSRTRTRTRTRTRSRTLKKSKTLKPDKFANGLAAANPANLGLLNKVRQLKEYYTIVEPDKIRALAYGKAWLTLTNYPEEIMSGQQIAHLPGIGAKMIKKVGEYLQDGEMEVFRALDVSRKLEDAQKAAQYDVAAVLGIGPARSLALHRQGIHTVDDLAAAHKSGKVKLSASELIGLEHHADLIQKIPRDEAQAMLGHIIHTIDTSQYKWFNDKWRPEIELAGSWPSGKPESKDIDLLVFSPHIKNLSDLKKHGRDLTRDLELVLKESGLLKALYSSGESKLLILAQLPSREYKSNNPNPVRHIDIRLIPTESAVFGRMYFTSGRDFNQILRLAAKKRGLKLNEFGLYRGAVAIPNLDTEEAIMSEIGVPFVPMAKRR
jgi:endonuclease IV/DNA polymerase/3'-5' exonuclease PolX